MKITRNGVFETNSSSSHSISIHHKCKLNDTISPNDNGIIDISYGGYGWGWEILCSAKEKASYWITYWNEVKENIKGHEGFPVIENEVKDFAESRITMLKEVVQEFCGYPVSFTESSEKYYPKGYVDHQAFDQNIFLKIQTKGYLTKFIFSKNAFVCIGNDNENSPIINFAEDQRKHTANFILTIENGDEIYLKNILSDDCKEDWELSLEYILSDAYGASPLLNSCESLKKQIPIEQDKPLYYSITEWRKELRVLTPTIDSESSEKWIDAMFYDKNSPCWIYSPNNKNTPINFEIPVFLVNTSPMLDKDRNFIPVSDRIENIIETHTIKATLQRIEKNENYSF